MSTHEISIVNLVNRPQLGDRLARWHVDEWGHLYADEVWNLEIARREFANMTADCVPLTLLAINKLTDECLGSVSLIADDDLPGFQHLTPWLASLFVAPSYRGSGIARALITAVLEEAGRLNHERVYLFTAGQDAFYRERGWVELHRATAQGHDAVVMMRSTSPIAARRALVTSWIGNPNFGGSYSHLRPHATPQDRAVLGQRQPGNLWFAGEATSVDHPGTLHGAWFSGLRVARELHESAPTATVAIVGAGMAGLAAATELRAKGHAVNVFEAEPRLGGRALTDRSLGGPIHVGGAWMHGTEGHPLEEFGLHGSPGTFDATRVVVSGSDLAESDFAALLDRIETQLDAQLTTEQSDSFSDSLAAIDHELAAPLAEFAGANDLPRVEAHAALACLLRGSYENLYAAPPGELSLRYRSEPYGLPGEDQLITDPIDTFVAAQASDLAIHTSTRVSKIARQSPSSGSTTSNWQIATIGGANADDAATHLADAVIVTVGIGVLQSDRIEFLPPLPERFTTSLHRLGPGSVAKAFFTFDTKFWTQRSWYVAADPPVVFELWVDVSELAGRPMLCAFACASVAKLAEAMTEPELCAEADRNLRLANFGSYHQTIK